MTISTKTNNSETRQISEIIGRRAGNIFITHQLWCSGAALLVLNRGLGGDLSEDQVIRLTSGLGDGLSGAGCMCGGLNGASLGLGLFLGHGRLTPKGNETVIETTRMLHDQFKEAFGATCCRALVKRKPSSGSRDQLLLCAHRTSLAASVAAQFILLHRPELTQQIDWKFLNSEDTRIGACLKMIASRLSKK